MGFEEGKEDRDKLLFYLGQGDGGAVIAETGNFLVFYATGDNEVKAGQVTVDVDGETVHSYPAFDFNADGGDFFVSHPYACQAGDSSAGDAVLGQQLNYHLFQLSEVPM